MARSRKRCPPIAGAEVGTSMTMRPSGLRSTVMSKKARRELSPPGSASSAAAGSARPSAGDRPSRVAACNSCRRPEPLGASSAAPSALCCWQRGTSRRWHLSPLLLAAKPKQRCPLGCRPAQAARGG